MRPVGEAPEYQCVMMRRDAQWNIRKRRVVAGSREIEEKKYEAPRRLVEEKGLALIRQ